MKAFFILVLSLSSVVAYSQWSGSTTTTGTITRTGSVEINGLTYGRYGGPLSGDSNPYTFYNIDGLHDLTIFGSNASTLNLRLYDGDLKMGLNAIPNSVFYNAGNLSLGGTVGDRLSITGDGFVNMRTGRWATFGETGGGIATVLGSNVKASNTINNKLEIITTTVDGARAIKMQYNEGISFHTYQGAVTSGNDFTGYERMRIDVNGNVGIGLPNPDARLTVKGDIHTNEIRVDVQSPIQVGDYVFEKEYELLPLSKVEEYVNENKHLPEVPSAKEISEEGLKLKEMNLLLLKKIEELTLHLIEMEKKNQSQDKLIQKLLEASPTVNPSNK